MTAIAVTIAGSDSGGGAGIQADLKTFSALGVYGASVIAALTAQNTIGVQGVHEVPADFVRLQMNSVFADLDVKAVKIGMLASAALIDTVVDGLAAVYRGPIVLDPVMVAASGDPLLQPDALAILRARLLPMADLITPNLPEAAMLLGEAIATDQAAMRDQAARLMAFGAKAVLIKGGHDVGVDAIDVLMTGSETMVLPAKRIDTANTHGTGCTLSSAIAAGLAKGVSLRAAVEAAKAYITAAIAASDQLSIGTGHGPVHHFHGFWPRQQER